MSTNIFRFIQRILLFSYGTTTGVADRHLPQARMIAITIGGLILFVSLPFIFCGTTYLLHPKFAFIDNGFLRWFVLLLASTGITFAVIWVERALLVLAEAVRPHPAVGLGMLLLRVGLVFLFSAVIAEKLVVSQYEGPIRLEILAMKNEAQAIEQKRAKELFNVDGLGGSVTSIQARIKELELKLATLPQEITSQMENLEVCRAESTTYSRSDPDYTESDTRCRTLLKTLEVKKRSYLVPIETELTTLRTSVRKNESAFNVAVKASNDQAMAISNEASTALSLNGSEDAAFTRVREKYPQINRVVLMKTLLLAAIELLPILLKLFAVNSPIACEGRMALQQESEYFRFLLNQSIERERHYTGARGERVGGQGLNVFEPQYSHYIPPLPTVNGSEN